MLTPNDWSSLLAILGKPSTDRTVEDFVRSNGPAPVMSVVENYGHLEFPHLGIDVTFKQKTRKGPFFFYGVHLYSSGHQGYQEYRGHLLAGLAFGTSSEDIWSEITSVFGESCFAVSRSPNTAQCKWVRYDFDKWTVHFQFNTHGGAELITLFDNELMNS